MIHFNAKHQKSEAKMKVKLSEKIEAKRKLSEKIDKNVFFFHLKRNWEAK
jgi:hypothetical protein